MEAKKTGAIQQLRQRRFSDIDFPAVSSLGILNPFNLMDYYGLRKSIIDCLAQSDDGRFFNFEIQTNELRDFDKGSSKKPFRAAL